MRSQVLHETATRHIVAVFDKGDEASERLADVARLHAMTAASFTAIGAFESVTLGWFDPEERDYRPIAVDEQVEVVSLVGDVSVHEGDVMVHAHVVVGCRDRSTRGGHLLSATVWPTLEVVFTETPAVLRRALIPRRGWRSSP